MKKHISTFRMLFAAILLVGLFVVVGVVSSQSPETAEADVALAPDAPSSLLFSYQGQLMDTNGDPITNNALPITFRLFTVESGGTECWSEAHSVDVEDGLFHVLLGQTSTIDPDCVAGDAFLELVVGEDIEAEVLIPREQLASVSYSTLSADVSAPLDVDGRITSSGVGGGDLMALNPNNQSASVALNWMNDVARIRIGGTGTGAVGGLDIQTQGDDSLLRILDNGNVGIGTVSPGEKLDVIGNIDLHDHELRNVEEIRSDNDYVGFFKVATSGAEGIRVGDIGIDSSYTNANTNLGSLGDNGLWVKGNAGVGGNVGIGTVNPSEKLHISGGQVLVEASRAKTLLNFNYEQGSTATTFYQHLATLDANNGMVQVEGTLGAHSKTEGKASVNLVFSLRGGVVAQGIVNGELIRSDIVLYEDSGVYRIYLKTDAWSQVNLRLTTNGSSALNSNPTTETSVPGTLLYSAKTDAQLVLDFSGNVGVGTTSPTSRLTVLGDENNGTNAALKIRSGTQTLLLDGNEVDGNEGLHLNNNVTQNLLLVNGGGRIGIGTTNPQHGRMQFTTGSVPFAFQESDQTGAGSLWRMPLDGKILRFDVSQNGTDWTGAKTPLSMYQSGEVSTGSNLNMGGDLNMNGHTVSNCGALTEANLQTPEELASERIERFEEGDVLCWSTEPDQLELCATSGDSLIMAVADAKGRPIVMGAEPIKVLGSVKVGDYLVASDVPGYAMATDNPVFGIVIAQALEDFDGDRGLIKAMIRKM